MILRILLFSIFGVSGDFEHFLTPCVADFPTEMDHWWATQHGPKTLQVAHTLQCHRRRPRRLAYLKQRPRDRELSPNFQGGATLNEQQIPTKGACCSLCFPFFTLFVWSFPFLQESRDIWSSRSWWILQVGIWSPCQSDQLSHESQVSLNKKLCPMHGWLIGNS